MDKLREVPDALNPSSGSVHICFTKFFYDLIYFCFNLQYYVWNGEILYELPRKLRKDNRSKKIMLNLSVAIGLVDLVFITGMQDYSAESQVGCKVCPMYLLLSANGLKINKWTE